MFETIVALATAPLKSALSIVRLSGDDCFFVVNKIFSKDLTKYTKNSIIHGQIIDGTETVDDVVLLLYIAPHSFTGENSVEIISHGSPIIFNKIIDLCIKSGARLATGGEFSSRAYFHGKMNLMEAESINDLINAESEESKKISMMALEGKTSLLIEPIKTKLGDLLSNIEVNIDYPEYLDIEEANNEKIVEFCRDILKYIDELIKNGNKGNIIKDGIKVAIVGKPNVGKSSILNALLNEEKAIVTNIKGTTRDIVEGKINLNGVIINLFDTAGIRESSDVVEEIGIKKSIEKLNDSDIVLCVFDSANFDNEDKEILELVKNKKHIIVYNKSDLIKEKVADNLYISALNKDIEPLKNKILEILDLKKENYENPSIANVRELGLLKNIKEILKNVLRDTENDVPIDIINSEIKEAYLKTLSITGEDFDFDISKEIFSRFCVGK
ncbi:MAG: tRNA uridine-5-carboxymethylaminomethyl(34) synthesis GTPase MnmE [bacterium]|nr:tRNA uridine-5-carboxymethylaminomethyl(34) synthesis GTPase MnmE [bacterium]MDY4159520.1 tRNA uridine-5-carboxymethylaminomethyl(34) synthesis GTPase MnmE [Candidatus Onthovivens sp.]